MRALLALALTGCLTAPTTGADDPSDGPPETSPDDAEPTPVHEVAVYQVTSAIDLTVEALVPQTAADAVELLRTFRDSPGRALFDLAEDAGVPAVGTIRDALPSSLESKVYSWIDAQLAAYQPLAGDIVAIAETSLATASLDSTLATDNGVATHTLTSVNGIALPAIVATTTVSRAAGALSIGDHSYGLAYGEIVWQQLDLEAQLTSLIDCTAVAKAVAAKCYLGVCVGHEAELTQVCAAGVAELVERAHAELASMRFDVLHFAAGNATVVDSGLTGGVWDAEINAGQGLRHAPATFTAE